MNCHIINLDRKIHASILRWILINSPSKVNIRLNQRLLIKTNKIVDAAADSIGISEVDETHGRVLSLNRADIAGESRRQYRQGAKVECSFEFSSSSSPGAS